MRRFQFKLAAVQRYREHLRDVVRQELAVLLARETLLIDQRDTVLQRRAATIREMQALQEQPQLDVDQTASRRYHTAQLTAEARQLEWQRLQVAELIAHCRERLIRADQSVKVLDQLEDGQRLAFEKERETQESRQREDAWQAGQLVKSAAAAPAAEQK